MCGTLRTGRSSVHLPIILGPSTSFPSRHRQIRHCRCWHLSETIEPYASGSRRSAAWSVFTAYRQRLPPRPGRPTGNMFTPEWAMAKSLPSTSLRCRHAYCFRSRTFASPALSLIQVAWNWRSAQPTERCTGSQQRQIHHSFAVRSFGQRTRLDFCLQKTCFS